MIAEERPWGRYEVLYQEAGVQVKRIELKPGMRFSLQKHLKRAEKWIILSGVGLVTLGNREIPIKKGSFIEVPCEAIHRMQNTGKETLIFIEVQFGDYLGEDDIVRFDDDFGRK